MDIEKLSKNSTEITVAVFVTGIIFYFFFLFYMSKTDAIINFHNRKIKEGWKNNEFIERLHIISDNIIALPNHPGIVYSVRTIRSRKGSQEPCVIKDIKQGKIKINPFAPEHRKDLTIISSLSESHALIYNKFPIVPYHVLVIPKEFEYQNTRINAGDWEGGLMAMISLDGLIFFNSGPKAGSSQEHKHLQIIPCNSFTSGQTLIDALINSKAQTREIRDNEDGFIFEQFVDFKFNHLIYKFRDIYVTTNSSDADLKAKAKQLELIYSKCLKLLKNEDLSKAYNILATKRWLFIVNRIEETAMNMIKINAVGFAGSFVVRTEDEAKFMNINDPLQILASVSEPVD